jgi:hypothetical protein
MMGKRSTFERRPQDAYDTPPQAVVPLVPHLPEQFVFYEPCAGKADLYKHLMAIDDTDDGPLVGCSAMIDIVPRHPWVLPGDALECGVPDGTTHIITNPPWTRSILHPMIEHFSDMRPTWLLFDADWMHTKQAAPYLWRLRKIVSVGRVKWIPDSPHTGKDNVCWYLFDAHSAGPTEFVGRSHA